MDLVSAELPAKTLVVAIDPGKATNRVLLTDGERGLIGEPVSLPTLREGVERLCALIAPAGRARDGDRDRGDRLAASGLGGRARAPLARLDCGSSRLQRPRPPAPSWGRVASRPMTATAPRWSLSLAREAGRAAQSGTLDALLDAVRHRRRLIAPRKVARQHLHDQLNALCPGLSAPAGHGRVARPRDPDGPGGAGLRGRLRRPGARSPLADRQGPGPALATPAPPTGLSAGAAAWRRPPTPSCAPGDWVAT